jgi:hypothetical protein
VPLAPIVATPTHASPNKRADTHTHYALICVIFRLLDMCIPYAHAYCTRIHTHSHTFQRCIYIYKYTHTYIRHIYVYDNYVCVCYLEFDVVRVGDGAGACQVTQRHGHLKNTHTHTPSRQTQTHTDTDGTQKAGEARHA